jgi:hypothetical protein
MKKQLPLYIFTCLTLIASENALSIDFQNLYKTWSSSSNIDYSNLKGKDMWSYELIPGRSCSGCHGNNLLKNGKHMKTKKIIKSLSPKVNSKRLSDVKKIKKWLKRNCKYTYKRECTGKEKIEFIEFIRHY